MRVPNAALAVLAALSLAACNNTNTGRTSGDQQPVTGSPDDQVEVPQIPGDPGSHPGEMPDGTPPPEDRPVSNAAPRPTGTLRLLTIYDFGSDDFTYTDGYRYEDAFRLNGTYEFPEPIYGSWAMRVTPLAGGPAVLTTSLGITTGHDGGRYLRLPAGRYRVEWLQPTSTGGGQWSVVGANSGAGSDVKYGAVTSLEVDVVAGSKQADATTVRFLTVCRVNGEPVHFVADETVIDWRMPAACKPDFESATPSGSLDTTFGTSGSTTLTVPGSTEFADSVTVQPDGKIVLAGYKAANVAAGGWRLALARLTRDGQLDPSFGEGGWSILEQRGLVETVKVLPDGRLLVLAFLVKGDGTPGRVALLRLSPDGSLDTTYGAGGLAEAGFGGSSDYSTELLAQPDGSALVVGIKDILEDSSLGAVTRLLPDGSRDLAYGSGGVALVDLPGKRDQFEAGALQSDGSLVLGGLTYLGSDVWFSGTISRLGPEGKVDAGFGDEGTVLFNATGYGSAEVYAVAVMPDGRIVGAGSAQGGGAVFRLGADGKPDLGFGQDGIAVTQYPLGGGYEHLVLLADGRILAAGSGAVARYMSDGSLDSSLGGLGVRLLPASLAAYEDLALQPDGRLVFAGALFRRNAGGSGDWDVIARRFNP